MPDYRFATPEEFGQPGDQLTGRYDSHVNPLFAPAIAILLQSVADLVFVVPKLLPAKADPLQWHTLLWPYLLIKLAIVLGAVGMLRLRWYRLTLLAAELLIFSACFPLGIVLGLWALGRLSRESVKQRFR